MQTLYDIIGLRYPTGQSSACNSVWASWVVFTFDSVWASRLVLTVKKSYLRYALFNH